MFLWIQSLSGLAAIITDVGSRRRARTLMVMAPVSTPVVSWRRTFSVTTMTSVAVRMTLVKRRRGTSSKVVVSTLAIVVVTLTSVEVLSVVDKLPAAWRVSSVRIRLESVVRVAGRAPPRRSWLVWTTASTETIVLHRRRGRIAAVVCRRHLATDESVRNNNFKIRIFFCFEIKEEKLFSILTNGFVEL